MDTLAFATAPSPTLTLPAMPIVPTFSAMVAVSTATPPLSSMRT